MTALRVVPLTLAEARAFVERVHSHHHAHIQQIFAVGVERGGATRVRSRR